MYAQSDIREGSVSLHLLRISTKKLPLWAFWGEQTLLNVGGTGAPPRS
jgi:hypothetical protein